MFGDSNLSRVDSACFVHFISKLGLLSKCHSGLAALNQGERNDLMEVLDDRVGTRSTLITSQFPAEQRHAYPNDPTLADAILHRMLHAAHKVLRAMPGAPTKKRPPAEAV